MIPSSYHKENESNHTSINNDDSVNNNNHFGASNPISSSSGEASMFGINRSGSSFSPANKKNQTTNNRDLLKSEILVDSFENNEKIFKKSNNNKNGSC